MNQISRIAGLPVLDLSGFGAENSDRAGFLADLRAAAREVGFFYVTGHGVPEELNAAILNQARALFALPEEQKLAIEMVNSPHFRGYNRAGFEYTRGKPDWREQIDIGAEEAAVPRDDGAPAYMRLRGPNQWPATLPDFKPIVLESQERVTAVLVRLLPAFALALEQSQHAFAPL